MPVDIFVVLLIILVAVLIWRGPKTLPRLGEALGRGVKEAKAEAAKAQAEIQARTADPAKAQAEIQARTTDPATPPAAATFPAADPATDPASPEPRR